MAIKIVKFTVYVEESFLRRAHSQRLSLLVGVVLFMTTWLSPMISPVFALNPVEAADDTLISLPPASTRILPRLDIFARSVQNGRTESVAGVYIPQIMAYPVVQQPAGQAGYVSTRDQDITQFSLAQKYNTVGLLAHNYLAGESFFNLQPAQEVVLVYGDGSQKHYRISNVEMFQALTPNSPYSNFIELNNPDVLLSTLEVFNRIYAKGGRLVFQTCIKKGNELSWGRIFITALPYEKTPDTYYPYRVSIKRIR